MSFSDHGGIVIAIITDPRAEKSEITAAFKARGYDISVRVAPVPPALVGEILGGAGIGFAQLRNGTTGCAADRPRKVGLRILPGYHGHTAVTIAGPALPGERYQLAPGIFLPGEPLHCSTLLGASVSTATPRIAKLGYAHVTWSVDGGPTNPTRRAQCLLSESRRRREQ